MALAAANLTRRIVLNTLKSLPAFAALTLGIAIPATASALEAHSVGLLLAAQATGQTNKSQAASDRHEAEDLMVRARQAIKEGNIETADSLITRAEKLNVEYSMFRLGDTPKKLRADLNAAKRKGKKETPERPSQKFTPESSEPKSTEMAAAPAVGAANAAAKGAAPKSAQTEVTNPLDEEPIVLPSSGGRLTQSAPLQNTASPLEEEAALTTHVPAPAREHTLATEPNPDARRQADAQLLAARRALAVGDIRRASAAVEAARKAGARYGFHDDTPDKVDLAIRTYRQATESANGRTEDSARRALAEALMDQAQQLMRWRDYDEAERLVQHVRGMRLSFGPFEAQPDALLEKIAEARSGNPRGPQAAPRTGEMPPKNQSAVTTAAGRAAPPTEYPTTQAKYDRQGDRTRVARTAAQEESAGELEEVATDEPTERLPPPSNPRQLAQSSGDALQQFKLGEQALKDRDIPRAIELFRQAYAGRDQLDPATAQRLQDHLQLLSAPQPGQRSTAKPEPLLDSEATKQQLLVKQMASELAQKQVASGKLQESNPKKAREILVEARATIENSSIDVDARNQLMRRVDRSMTQLDKYIADHRAEIELDEANKAVLKEVDRKQSVKIEIDDKLAKLVDEFNQLMDEQRYAEAEVLAKRAREMDPDNPVVKQLIWQNKFVSRTQRNNNIIEDKEKAAWQAFDSVEGSAIPFDDREPYRMPDAKKWDELTKTRQKQLAENRSRRSEREIDIQRKLKTPVSLKFRDRPLSEVLEQLAKLAAVNLHLDPEGLQEEGVSSDTLVTIDLTQDISLKSALNLILEPLHLSYVIQDEVLKITSEQLRDGVTYPVTYNVADLIIPIPNFQPNARMGLAGALADAMVINGATVNGMGGAGTVHLASQDGSAATGVVDPRVLAQMNQLMPSGGARMGDGKSAPFGSGAGGAQANFDELIDLIQNTVKPLSWEDSGGNGRISEFRNNLSLVITQTQEAHEDIVDLLEQLRKNQDLQVTIEVRFITLNDNFFERIGVDFQFNITNNAPRDPNGPGNKKEIVGLLGPAGGAPNYTQSIGYDIPFRQSSYSLATPQFGTPVDVASFGFAILSDLEAFLLVSAAQGDRRSNVLQAPKVTLFNGQTASVSDVTQTPFVISVIPVVGDFAAAYQPVITVLSEGTFLSVQATISNDRRFVRLTVLPFFSQIGDVTEFTFSGTKTTTKNTSESSSTGGTSGTSKSAADDETTTSNGITVQLPNFSIVSVNTTVSVPDGGTVLLGGIKRLSEGRNEFGVPILSKLPYINRLFKNVGIGRETQSLMMMVTPRIIIQEEEEERLGIQAAP